MFGSNLVRVRGSVLKVDHARMKPVFRLSKALQKAIVILILLAIFANVLPQLIRGLVGMVMSIFFLFAMISIVPSIMMGMGSGRMGMPNPMRMVNGITGGLFRSMRSFSRGGHSSHSREIAVHNVTMIDRASGRNVLVRIEGDIHGGDPAPGHEIEVEGTDHNGTILFRCGLNHSLGLAPGGTQIVVYRHW